MEDAVLGILESRSLARGLCAQDLCLKEAKVASPLRQVFEPGRLLFTLTGEVDAVRSALRRGRQALGGELVGSALIPQVEATVLAALAGPRPLAEAPAVGLIELHSATVAIESADAAVKAAEVHLLRVRLFAGMAGKGLVLLAGETDDVEAAVTAAASLAESQRGLLRTETISGPHAAFLAGLAAL